MPPRGRRRGRLMAAGEHSTAGGCGQLSSPVSQPSPAGSRTTTAGRRFRPPPSRVLKPTAVGDGRPAHRTPKPNAAVQPDRAAPYRHWGCPSGSGAPRCVGRSATNGRRLAVVSDDPDVLEWRGGCLDRADRRRRNGAGASCPHRRTRRSQGRRVAGGQRRAPPGLGVGRRRATGCRRGNRPGLSRDRPCAHACLDVGLDETSSPPSATGAELGSERSEDDGTTRQRERQELLNRNSGDVRDGHI